MGIRTNDCRSQYFPTVYRMKNEVIIQKYIHLYNTNKKSMYKTTYSIVILNSTSAESVQVSAVFYHMIWHSDIQNTNTLFHTHTQAIIPHNLFYKFYTIKVQTIAEIHKPLQDHRFEDNCLRFLHLSSI